MQIWHMNGYSMELMNTRVLKLLNQQILKVERTYVTGSMTEDQIKASNELKAMFPKILK